MGLTKRSSCKTWGKPFISAIGMRRRFCSRACKRIANTLQHREYVAKNRMHLREYARERRIHVWGESSPAVAAKAERFAIERILPKLGFSDLYHVSAFNSFVPFDIIATYHESRVLIDVTTNVSKGTTYGYQQSFARALRMPIYVLFVKPDMTKYQLKLWAGQRKTAHMHLSELVAVE